MCCNLQVVLNLSKWRAVSKYEHLLLYFYFYCIVCVCPLGLKSLQAGEACETRTVKAQCAPHTKVRSYGIGFHTAAV